ACGRGPTLRDRFARQIDHGVGTGKCVGYKRPAQRNSADDMTRASKMLSNSASDKSCGSGDGNVHSGNVYRVARTEGSMVWLASGRPLRVGMRRWVQYLSHALDQSRESSVEFPPGRRTCAWSAGGVHRRDYGEVQSLLPDVPSRDSQT